MHGFASTQVDLNNAFVPHMISDDELTVAASGTLRRSEPLSLTAARWVMRQFSAGALSREDFSAVGWKRAAPCRTYAASWPCRTRSTPVSTSSTASATTPVLVASYDRFFTARLEAIVGQAADGDTSFGISVPMGPQLLPALRLAAVVRAATETGPAGSCSVDQR